MQRGAPLCLVLLVGKFSFELLLIEGFEGVVEADAPNLGPSDRIASLASRLERIASGNYLGHHLAREFASAFEGDGREGTEADLVTLAGDASPQYPGPCARGRHIKVEAGDPANGMFAGLVQAVDLYGGEFRSRTGHILPTILPTKSVAISCNNPRDLQEGCAEVSGKWLKIKRLM